MLQWISQHSSSLTVIANFGILAVWLFYAQILLNSVLQQRRPRLLINQGKGQDLDAEIMVANMSEQGVFIQAIMAIVETDAERFSRFITDVTQHSEGNDSENHGRRTTSQGPLGSGSYMQLGSFRQIAQWVSPGERERVPWQSLEIRVIFFYSVEAKPVAGCRRFVFRDGDCRHRVVQPETVDTKTLGGLRYRRAIQRWLRDNL